MDMSSVHLGKRPGSVHVLPAELDMKQIFFTNLQLLGFDAAAMEMKYKIPFNKEMFNLPNKAGAEAVLHFLFNRLNPTMCQQEFRDCWPVTDKKAEAAFRKICCIWLQNIQKEEADARLPRINASLILSPVGDKFYQLLFAFSTFIVLQALRKEHGLKDISLMGNPVLTPQNKELGIIMETTVHCAAVRHRRRYMETLGQIASVKQSWQKYADELTRSFRSLAKEKRELERDVREEIQTAAQKGLARGSPIPASRRPQDFDMSEHSFKRTQRLQQVRGVWKEVEGYLERSKEEQDILCSIVDRTQEKFAIDANHVQISIPHLMLRECEQEMRRRQVENIYEGGELNLVSVLQLWNMALRMYTKRLEQGGLKDLSEETNDMRSQVHSHQAYLANMTRLREKMSREIPHRMKSVTKLRNLFHSEVNENTSGLGMTAPSPPMNFDPPRGHSGVTPTGPVAQMPGDRVETPEAAAEIAKSIYQTSRKTPAQSFKTRAFGRSAMADRNQNNSNRLPQPVPRSRAGESSGASKERPRSSVSGKGRGGIQPRVIRHVGRQPAAAPPSSSSLKKPGPGQDKDKGAVSSGGPLASTPEKTPGRRAADPGPSDCNNSAAQTARHRAHNMLADKIVWAVMHGDEEGEGGGGEVSQELGLISPPVTQTSALSSSTSTWDTTLTPPRPAQKHASGTLTSHTTLTPPRPAQKHASDTLTFHTTLTPPCPAQKHASDTLTFHTILTPPRPAQKHASDTLTSHTTSLLSHTGLPASPQSLADSHQKAKTSSHKQASIARRMGELDSEGVSKAFVRAASPVTLVQQAHMLGAEDCGGGALAGGGGALAGGGGALAGDHVGAVHRDRKRTEGDGGEPEAEDVNIENPSAALSEEVFVTHDLIYRSPLAGFISQMWHEAISDDTENKDSSSDKDVAADWLDSDRGGVAVHDPTSCAQQSSDSPEPTVPSGQILREVAQECPDLHSQSPVSGEQAEGGQSSACCEGRPDVTMINSTQAFVTSFDEDGEQLQAQDRTVEWEERRSALYDDQEELEEAESDRRSEHSSEDVIAFSSAVDSLLKDSSDSGDGIKAPPRTDSGEGPTLAGNLAFPLISFTPQKTVSEARSDKTQSVDRKGESVHQDSCAPASDRRKSPVTLGQDSMKFSPEGSSDKENYAAAAEKGGAPQSSRSSRLLLGDRVGNSLHENCSSDGVRDSTVASYEEAVDEDDLLNVSGASPFNDSFTPLRSGLLVQGKSPAKSTLKNTSDNFVPQNAVNFTSRAEPSAGLNLDDNLAAQLSRLRKLKSEAFSGLKMGEPGSEQDRDGNSTDTRLSSLLSASLHTEAVGREKPAATGQEDETGPLDIFGEDDSILLPPSP